MVALRSLWHTMMISALPSGRSVLIPVLIHQCHLNLRSEMRDDDEVVSRCLPQQATVRSTFAQEVYQQILNTPLLLSSQTSGQIPFRPTLWLGSQIFVSMYVYLRSQRRFYVSNTRQSHCQA